MTDHDGNTQEKSTRMKVQRDYERKIAAAEQSSLDIRDHLLKENYFQVNV